MNQQQAPEKPSGNAFNPELRYRQPPMINRFTAAFIDLVVFVAMALAIILGSGMVLANVSGYADLATQQSTHYLTSQLHQVREIENGQYKPVALMTNEFMARTYPVENGKEEYLSVKPKNAEAQYSEYKVIQILAYFYCSYMAGDESALRANDYLVTDGLSIPKGAEYVVSPNAHKETIFKKNTVIPSETFTIEWFNRNVLEVNPGGQGAGNQFFELTKNDDDSVNWNKVAVIRPSKYSEFFQTGMSTHPSTDTQLSLQDPLETINYSLGSGYFKETANTEFQDFFSRKMDDAVTYFGTLDYMHELYLSMDFIAHYVAWSFLSLVIVVYFLIIPLCMKKGQTIGRLLFKIGVVNRKDGFVAKKWQTLLRFIPYVLVVIMGLLLKLVVPISDIVVLGILFGLYLIDIILVLLTKDFKLSVEDYFSNTSLADYSLMEIHKDIVEEVRYKEEKIIENANKAVQPKINSKYDARTHK